MKNIMIISFVFIISFNIQSQITDSRFNQEMPTKTTSVKRKSLNYYLKPAKVKNFTNVWLKIDAKEWEYVDILGVTSSSFIQAGKYYFSSDISFMVLRMNGNYYLYKNVPFNVWTSFKNSYSLGTYYNQHIRGNYLILTTE